jgi:sigma-B regulation protein RsbU (phosphoserine phosphatase)
MRWTFGTKLTALVFVLLAAAVGGATVFFLKLYGADKVRGIERAEIANAASLRSHLESLLQLADVISLDRVRDSGDLIYLYEDPCVRRPTNRGVVSRFYEKALVDLELEPRLWIDTLEVFKLCAETLPGGTAARDGVFVLPARGQMTIPYLSVLIRKGAVSRLAVLAMDGFGTGVANTIFLVDSTGRRLWAADGNAYADQAISDAGVSEEEISTLAARAARESESGISEAGSDGLLSYAPIAGGWTALSLSYRPTALGPVEFAMRQSWYLAGGFLFLCLFAGRRFAKMLTNPLEALRAGAERMGGGDLETRLAAGKREAPELAALKSAFNTMAERILKLVDDTKAKATIESELQIAEQVQKMLMPQTPAQTGSHVLYGFNEACTQCGGDWWGYFESKREGKKPALTVMIGDVTGHGTPSALITATVRGGLSVFNEWMAEDPTLAEDPREVLRQFNRVVFDAAAGTITMTFMATVFDLEASRLTCANAGHDLGYMLLTDEQGKGGALKLVGRSGQPLGYEPTAPYEEVDHYPWRPGSRILLYTDGLIENIVQHEGNTKNLWDKRDLKDLLKQLKEVHGREFMQRILSTRAKEIHGLPAADDITLVVCEARGGTFAREAAKAAPAPSPEAAAAPVAEPAIALPSLEPAPYDVMQISLPSLVSAEGSADAPATAEAKPESEPGKSS